MLFWVLVSHLCTHVYAIINSNTPTYTVQKRRHAVYYCSTMLWKFRIAKCAQESRVQFANRSLATHGAFVYRFSCIIFEGWSVGKHARISTVLFTFLVLKYRTNILVDYRTVCSRFSWMHLHFGKIGSRNFRTDKYGSYEISRSRSNNLGRWNSSRIPN